MTIEELTAKINAENESKMKSRGNQEWKSEVAKEDAVLQPAIDHAEAMVNLMRWLAERNNRNITHLTRGRYFARDYDNDENWESDTLIGLAHNMGLLK